MRAPLPRHQVRRHLGARPRPPSPASERRRDITTVPTKTVNFDALPTLDGEPCGVLLIKSEDEVAQGLPDAPRRAPTDGLLPQFSPSITDETLAQVIAKPPSRLPLFRYAGPTSQGRLDGAARRRHPLRRALLWPRRQLRLEDVKALGDAPTRS